MVVRYNPGSGCILQLVLGFGIGAGNYGSGIATGNLTKFDFSRAGDSGLIAVLRRF